MSNDLVKCNFNSSKLFSTSYDDNGIAYDDDNGIAYDDNNLADQA